MSYFSMKTCCRYSLEELSEVLLTSTHNISFHGEIRKISTLQGKKYTLSWYLRTLYVGNIVSLLFTDAFLLDNLSGIFDAIQISSLDVIHYACFF